MNDGVPGSVNCCEALMCVCVCVCVMLVGSTAGISRSVFPTAAIQRGTPEFPAVEMG